MKKLPGVTTLIISLILTVSGRGYALTIVQENGTWQKLSAARNFSTIEVTPWGIFTGENNSNWNSNPYNGVFVSSDLGGSWEISGLANRGVTDIAFDDLGNLYATVYYWSTTDPPGIYKSTDKGTSWARGGLNFSSAAVITCGSSVIVGSYSHGLWVSADSGVNWVQKKKPDTRLSSGDYLSVKNSNNVVIASNPYETYLSYDCGETWGVLEDVPSYINDLSIHNNIRLVCHGSVAGISRSTDSGATYSPVVDWGYKPCYSVTYYRGTFYASSYNNVVSCYTVFKSSDLGLTWEDISPAEITSQIKNLAWLASEPGYIFANVPGTGVYRYKVLPYVPKTQPFLSKLWTRNNMSEQTDTVTSYFDHSYPLLAYPYQSEGKEEADTTTNFWGTREKEPKLYYSSHEGVDFGLVYGTPILAPASGYASYTYTTGGGHTIKIDHQNGYQTQYLHFQRDGLFTERPEEKWIDKGQQVGLVGLTGNTTGPHLHFGVRYDKNQNGIFTDDIPDGRTDPYSWLDERKEDPWEIYSWTDITGDHNGTESAYLWEDFLEVNSQYLTKDGGEILGANVKVKIQPDTLDKDITLKLQKSTQVSTSFSDPNLEYIQNTATNLTAYDNLDNAVTSLTNLADITFDLSQANVSHVALDTLKAYYFNKQDLLWEQATSLWNDMSKTVTGFIDDLGEFAVFGEKIDPDPPITTITVWGEQSELWYITHPEIELSASDGENGSGVDTIFYSIDGGDSWEEYQTSVPVPKEGIFAVLFRSSDLAQNYEPAKDSPLLRVDTLGKFKDEILLTGVSFSTADQTYQP